MDEDEATPPPPAGFAKLVPAGPFSAHNGPFFEQAEAPCARAFFVLRRHCNKLGLVHGGMLTAFMDAVLAQASQRTTGQQGVTVNLSVDFLRMARRGDWVIGEGRTLRATRDLSFVEGHARVDGVEIVRASAIFKLMRGGGRTP